MSTRVILPWTAAILAALTVFAQEPDRIDALIAQLGDPDANVRTNAVNTLGRLGLPVEVSSPLLVELLQDESYLVRWQALAALPASVEAVPNLIAALRDEHRVGPTDWVRRGAARQLGRLRSVEAVPAFMSDPRQPVVAINWADADADAYCRWTGGRLPTEAEWEWAARGGLVGKAYSWGHEPPGPTAPFRANFDTGETGDADGYAYTAPVGRFGPNGYGLHDMSGDAWEWCADLYVLEDKSNTPPGWVGGGEHRVLRGGGWRIASYMPQDLYVTDLRVDFRMPYNAAVDDWNIGCRCAADAPFPIVP